MVSFTLNGSDVSVRGDHPHLLAALREELAVCSPKDGCSPSGQCGCCTVLVDGKAVVSCNLSVEKVAGAEITTLEGFPDERARPHGLRVRGHRRVAVRLLHAGDPRARRVAAREEGRRPRPRHRGAPSRRAPVPVHRLREDPRRGRAARQGRDHPARAARRRRHEREPLPGLRPRARRQGLRRRHAPARSAARGVAPRRPRARRRAAHRHDRGRSRARRRARARPRPTCPASSASG